MAVGGDSVTGYRTTPNVDSVDSITIELGVDQHYLYCYGYLLFYLDGSYVAYAELNPYYSYATLYGTIPVDPTDASPHEVTVELYNTLYNSSCWYSWITLDDHDSTVTLSGTTGSSDSVTACEAPSGYGMSGDCNDSNAHVNPGMMEMYNGYDDDCDGHVDEGADRQAQPTRRAAGPELRQQILEAGVPFGGGARAQSGLDEDEAQRIPLRHFDLPANLKTRP